MRNITYIKAALTGVLMGAPAFAADLDGCWTRAYDKDHLMGQPGQVVEKIMFGAFPGADGTSATADMVVVAANQGHAASQGLGGQKLVQFLLCYADKTAKAGWRCAVECDGGSLEITRLDEDMLEFRTDYLLIGNTDGCGGALDIAEAPGQFVTYRLYRPSGPHCGWE
ncbi:hypothetical protein [Aliiroseovarius sp.]|uniref:hypothetical protein n=1 Tax=Aliiroseovarius sp. TaxID=1872442 RepID=UPI003BABF457